MCFKDKFRILALFFENFNLRVQLINKYSKAVNCFYTLLRIFAAVIGAIDNIIFQHLVS